MRKKLFMLMMMAILLSACGAQSRVQDIPGIQISRNFGYSSLSKNEIQGNFTIAYSGPANVKRVVFMMDGKPVADKEGEYPYTFKFDTGSYSLGEHTISVVGYTQEGLALPAKEINVKFVSAGEGVKAGLQIAIPILGLVLLAIIVGIGGPLVFNRGKNQILAAGTPRNYGMRGGCICPRCKRPYVLHFFSLHIGLHKLDRCPYCGKWALVRPRSLADLRAAESLELEQASAPGRTSASSGDEKLRKDLEDSRFQDG
jgi:hypothetical protein